MLAAHRNNQPKTRRYLKHQLGDIRHQDKRQSNDPSRAHHGDEKHVLPSDSSSEEPIALKKFVDRFRYGEPRPRTERSPINYESDKVASCSPPAEKPIDPNIPVHDEMSELERRIQQYYNERPNFNINHATKDESSDMERVSSTGVGSTPSTTSMKTTSTISSVFYVKNEVPARPLFTKYTDSNADFDTEARANDILYQWRLRRRMEQAQQPDPVLPRLRDPPLLVNPSSYGVREVLVQRPSAIESPAPLIVPSIIKESSAQVPEIQKNIEVSIKSVATVNNNKEIRDATTQTVQEIAIQTSPTVSRCISPPLISMKATKNNLCHGTENDESIDVNVTPPSKPKKQPVVSSTKPSTDRHNLGKQHNHPLYACQSPDRLRCSRDSTLTRVTSVTRNGDDCHFNRNSLSATLTDLRQADHTNEDQENIIYDDDILNLLEQKRDALLVAYREIEEHLGSANVFPI